MVSQGRALAVAGAWIVVPLGAAAFAIPFSQVTSREDASWAVAIAVAAIVYLTPLALLAGAIWVARRHAGARSAAGLGAQAGLIGLIVAVLGALAYLTLRQGFP